MKEKQDKSHKFWDRVSGWSKAESAANSTLVKYINSNIDIIVNPSDTVLDYGCGTGTITLRIAKHTGKMFGVDISNGMLKRARLNNTTNNTTFLKITNLEEMFAAESFDAITIFNVLQYIENREEIFKNFHKLLKPNGKLIIAAPCFGDTNSLSKGLVSFLRLVRIMPETYHFSVNGIENEIKKAGFSIVESMNLSNLPERFIVASKKSTI